MTVSTKETTARPAAMSKPDLEALAAELRELEAANEAATGWGAAVGARSERIKEIKRILSRTAATASEPVAWRDIASAPRKDAQGRDVEIIVTGGTRMDQSFDYGDWEPFDDIALACYDSSLDCWRGEQTEQYGEFILHKPTHWVPKSALGKPGTHPAIDAAPSGDRWDEAIEALRPFAKIADLYVPDDADDLKLLADLHISETHVTVGMCRKARDAIRALRPAEGKQETKAEGGEAPCNNDLQVARFVSFLNEAANYFSSRPTGEEDTAFWANIANAETCRTIAKHLATPPRQPDAGVGEEEIARIVFANEFDLEDWDRLAWQASKRKAYKAARAILARIREGGR